MFGGEVVTVRPDKPKTPRPEKPPLKVRPPAPVSGPTTVDPMPVQPTPGKVEAFKPLPLAADPPPVDPPKADPVIRSPHWVKRPGANELARFYPERALRLGLDGRASIGCGVAANGALNGCEVLSETPPDVGFGEAAVKLSRYFRMSPQTVNGQPVDGARVVVPIVFRTPKDT